MKPKKILFVDDDRYEILPFVERLEIDGFDVTFLSDTDAARSCLEKGLRPDVMIVDLIMRTKPDQSSEEAHQAGLRFCQAARTLAPKAKVIILSVVTEGDIVDPAREIAHLYIRKPVTPSALVNKVNDLL